MKARYFALVSSLLLAVTGFVLAGPSSPATAGDNDHGNGDHGNGRPAFVVDPSWPKPLPAPVGTDGVAHSWVQGEVAGSCVDRNNNVYTYNRGWEVGATVNGVQQGNESGAIVGQDASASAIPSPPVVVFDEEGNTIAGWGNPSLYPASSPSFGFAAYMPYGSHGCFIDYQGYIWLAGNGDGVVQKYNPATAAAQGTNAAFVAQIGTKSQCDGPATSANTFTSCSETTSLNSSHTLLNEPADIAVDPAPDPVTGTTGSVYIADGYGNHRIVVYTTSDGGKTYQYNRQWGQACTINGVRSVSQACPPGTFGATGGGHPHCVVLGNDHLVYVCDRPNSRIQVFPKSCGAPSVGGSQPLCQPVKIYNIGLTPGVTPPVGSLGNEAFNGVTSPAAAAAIQLAGTRGDDLDFWPNIDALASLSPTSQSVMIDVDLGNDNTWLIDKLTGKVFGALGVCGILPCPGHNAGHFAFGHTTAVDSHGNIYLAETITGRRVQKFVPADGGR
jgi:hypothetical protein